MPRAATLLALLLPLGLLPAAPTRAAEEAKITYKTGGNYEVQTVKDVAYYDGPDADPVKHKLDLYLPKGHKDFPVLFFVHGGTWRSGDKKIYAPLGDLFARNGIGTVVISYRLSPKVQHPAHIQDVARAFAWTCAHIGEHGGRADQVFCCGHSAGGHQVSLLSTDESYLKAVNLSAGHVKGVIAMSAPLLLPPIVFASIFGKDEEVLRRASPLNLVKGDHPPYLLIYGDHDLPTLGGMAKQMGEKLQKCRCQADVIEAKGRDHVSIIKDMADPADPVTQAWLNFIAKHSGMKLTDAEKVGKPR
jgi:acetyl esterase/lipase